MNSRLKKIILASGITLIIVVGVISIRITAGPDTIPGTGTASDVLVPQQNQAESLPVSSLIPGALASGENVTREFAEKIAKELINKNPDGPSVVNGEQLISGLNPDLLVEQIINEGLKDIDYEKFTPVVSTNDFETIGAGGKAVFTEYFLTLQNIVTTHPLSLAGSTPSAFVAAANTLDSIVTELYEVSVPIALAELHAKEISLLVAEKNIFTSIANAGIDSLQALTAFHALPEIVNELNNLQKEFDAFAKTNGLVL